MSDSATDANSRGTKRAAVACDHCRRRKRRCDGKQPTCTLCEEAHASCEYSDAEPRRANPDAQELNRRFEALESLVQEQSGALARVLSRLSREDAPGGLAETSPAGPTGRIAPSRRPPPTADALPITFSATSPEAHQNASITAFSPYSAADAANQWTNNPIMTIPIGHSTTTGSLLSSPQVRVLVGEFEQDVFTRMEAQRAVPPQTSISFATESTMLWPVLGDETIDRLTGQFFSRVHIHHPVLDRDDFLSRLQICRGAGFPRCIDSALCFVVFALAEAGSLTPNDAERFDDTWTPGMDYFRPALQCLLEEYTSCFSTNVPLAQGLFFCAAYYGYLTRPLQSWRLNHMASTNLQHLLLSPVIKPENPVPSYVRVSWAVFLQESDLVAEHHLPRSGIEHVIENMPLPDGVNSSWLSEISARRLLNRVHFAMYAPDSFNVPDSQHSPQTGRVSASVGTPGIIGLSSAVPNELLRQLDVWFEMLPENVKPTVGQPQAMDRSKLAMLLRYHSTIEVICRPFLLRAMDLSVQEDMPDSLTNLGKTCVHACIGYIYAAEEWLKESSASTEVILQSTFAVAVVLTIASTRAHFSHLIPDVGSLQDSAIRSLRRWAFNGSCIECMQWIFQMAKHKSQIMRQSSADVHM